jgi:uncharacterized membrane protein
MPYCQNCGGEITGRFCGSCGAPAPGEPPPASGESRFRPSPSSFSPAPPPAASAGMTDNVASALCYLLGLLTGIIFLLISPYNQNRTVRFHAFQSIFLHLAIIVVSLVIVPALGVALGSLVWLGLSPLLSIGFIGVWLYMMYTAYQNQRVVLPIIGPLAERQA